MRTVRYTTHWSYLGPGIKRKNTLAEFVLDILYLMNETGVIPLLAVLNEVLLEGGDSGGMGPGTKWKPFQITESGYAELVETLLAIDLEEARKAHPYIFFKQIIIDDELNKSVNYLEWLRNSFNKYRRKL